MVGWSSNRDVRDTRVFIRDRNKLVDTVSTRLDFNDSKAVAAFKHAQCERLRLTTHRRDVTFEFRDGAGRTTIRQEAA